MSKWAEFVISGVRYNSTRTHIDAVEIRPDNGESIGAASVSSRTQVIAAMDRGTTFVTATRDKAGNWQRGADVGTVTIHGIRYLRTDRDSTARDNLGYLPEF